MLSKKNDKKIFAVILVALLALLFAWWLTTSRATACNVAYIKLQGDLITYIPASNEASSTEQDETASDDITQQVRDASADPQMKAIVLEIDSPGGYPVAGQEVESALKLVKKPTIALIRAEADSAAYMAAVGADTIFASEFSDVGDIGTTESYADQSQQDISNGITFNQLSVGQYKDMFDPDKPLTPAERTLVMSQLQVAYQNFVDIVAENRHMSTSSVLALANGAGVPGQQALQEGLIDKLGTIDDVRTFLTQKLGRSAIICGIDTDLN